MGPELATERADFATRPAVNRRPRTIGRLLGWILPGLLALPLTGLAASHPGGPSEYEVKAAYLYNFTRFIEWPESAFPGEAAPLVIGVVGENPFGAVLDELIREKVVNGHPLTVRRCRTAGDMTSCHLLFVTGADGRESARVLNLAHQAPIVTVGEAVRFARQGGTINFVLKDDRVGLEINRQAARLAGVRISSRLLNLATIVQTETDDRGESKRP